MRDDLPLPRWAYVPGTGNEPDRVPLETAKGLVPSHFSQNVPHDHPVLLYGLALNDRGFCWECHEILEAVWKAAPPGGCDKILLRALIQIANANLKQTMKQPRAVARLFGEALAGFDELSVRKKDEGGFATNYPFEAISAVLRIRLADPTLVKPVMLFLHGYT